MTRIHVNVPRHLLGVSIPLPYDPVTHVHAKEPEALGVHRMVGFDGQEEGRSLTVTRDGDGYRAHIIDGDGKRLIDVPYIQILAALSYLEGAVLSDTLHLVKSARGEVPHTIVKGVLGSGQRRVLNNWDGNEDPSPWAGVGLIIVSYDGNEIVFARKDGLHPRMNYARRLALIGGNIDPNEILSAWGGQRECAYVAMLRECFEEIRIPSIARQIASAMVYAGPAHANCYLYEDDGKVTGGTIRPFVAQAPSEEVWQEWRRIFSGEIDGLGEANPEIVTRDQLIELLRQDADAANVRKSFLKSADPSAIALVEEPLLARFSWKKIFARVRNERGLSDVELDEEVSKELDREAGKIWRAERESAMAEGLFPLMHRGRFHFISGHGGPISHALQHVGLL